MKRHLPGPPTAVVVAVAAMIQLAGTGFAAAHQPGPGHRPLDPAAWALLLAGPALLSLRRRYPVQMLTGVVAVTGTYFALGYSWGPVLLSPALAIIFACVAGKRAVTWSIAGAGVVVVVLVSFLQGGETWSIRAAAASAWLIILVLIGEGLRIRSERIMDRRRQREAEEQRARDEYRLALARDIHDVVAHSLSMINVRASVALHLGERDPAQLMPALEAIKGASKESLAEIRQLLGVLREDAPLAPPLHPARRDRLDRLPALVDEAGRGGLQIALTQRLSQPLTPEQETAAYRIVQEALTNVVRHAGARHADVAVTSGAGELVIAVEDDGMGLRGQPEGNGITGMRERVAALGGSLELRDRDPGVGVYVRIALLGGPGIWPSDSGRPASGPPPSGPPLSGHPLSAPPPPGHGTDRQ